MRLLALALSAVTARAACRNVTIDFLLLETNSMTAAIKDDIRSDLAVIGIDVVSRVGQIPNSKGGFSLPHVGCHGRTPGAAETHVFF